MNIVDMFSYSFMQNALLSGILISLSIPFISILVYIRRMNFISDAIGHINMSGIAFAVLISTFISSFEGYEFIIALIFTILGSILIEYLREKFKNYKEVSIVIVYALAISLTILFLNFTTGYNSGLFNLLFGNINAISKTEVLTLLIFTVIILIIMKFYFKKFLLLCLDEQNIKMYNLNYNFLRYFFTIILTIIIAMTIKVIGVLLVSSLLLIPLLSSNKLASSLKQTIIYNVLITMFSFVFGIILAYFLNVSASAIIVLLSFAIYITTLIVKRSKT